MLNPAGIFLVDKTAETVYNIEMKTLLIALVLAVVPLSANAGYFKLIDVKHPQVNIGESLTMTDAKPTTMLAIITHSRADGYWLIPGVDWTPFAVGGGLMGGKVHISCGPSWNALPVMQAGLLGIVNALTPADKYQNLKGLLQRAVDNKGDIAGSLGLNLERNFPVRIDVRKIQPLKGWIVPIFAGASWKF